MPIESVKPPEKKFKLYFDHFYDDPSQSKVNQPVLIDLVTLEKLYFQNIPNEINYESESGWVTIASPGRNNPLYQYTGSEDTISMTLTWYSADELRQDVLRKCKWLESLAKNNGFREPPHHVSLCFGNMFKGAIFIVDKAPSKFSGFSRPHGMFPQQASTDLVLKRITQSNRDRNNILKMDS